MSTVNRESQWNEPLMPAAERYGFTMLLDELERHRKILNSMLENLRDRVIAIEKRLNA